MPACLVRPAVGGKESVFLGVQFLYLDGRMFFDARRRRELLDARSPPWGWTAPS